MKYHVAVVGATGKVGRAILNSLAERAFPYRQIDAVASRQSAGKQVSVGMEHTVDVQSLDRYSFEGVDIAFFALSAPLAAQYVPHALAAGAVVIDQSTHYRMAEQVVLCVPELNKGLLPSFETRPFVVANPNCVAIPLAMALQPVAEVAGITQVVVSTYQSVSGMGKDAMDELFKQTKCTYLNQSHPAEILPRNIAFNVIPQVDYFLADGMTFEEQKIVQETHKLLQASFDLSVTCVRVPVFVGHSLSVYVQCEMPFTLEEIYEALSEADGIHVVHPSAPDRYVTPTEIVGEDAVYISRLRSGQTASGQSTLQMWVTSDNIAKGAALNAVQIAEALVMPHHG